MARRISNNELSSWVWQNNDKQHLWLCPALFQLSARRLEGQGLHVHPPLFLLLTSIASN